MAIDISTYFVYVSNMPICVFRINRINRIKLKEEQHSLYFIYKINKLTNEEYIES